MEASEEASLHEVIRSKTRRNIEKNGAAARQRAASDLQRHLVECINKPDYSDVVFVCKDEVEVHASKMFCMGRSKMLCAMFKSGMSECKSATVKLPAIKSCTLLSILEYLYTGDILHYRPKDWKMRLEVIVAARYLILPSSVEPIMEAILSELVNDIGKDLQQAAMMLSAAVECKYVHVELIGGVAHLLRNAWMQEEYACHLTEEAVDLILKRTKCTKGRAEDFIKPSLGEYFRFRGVMKWVLCTSGLAKWDGAENLFDDVIPVAREKLRRLGRVDAFEMDLVWLPGYKCDHTEGTNPILAFLSSHESCRHMATRLLANVDWRAIPSQVFMASRGRCLQSKLQIVITST